MANEFAAKSFDSGDLFLGSRQDGVFEVRFDEIDSGMCNVEYVLASRVTINTQKGKITHRLTTRLRVIVGFLNMQNLQLLLHTCNS